MTYITKKEVSAYITDENGRHCASVKAVTAGATLFDVFIAPTAGVNHHIQLSAEEIEAIVDMLSAVLRGTD